LITLIADLLLKIMINYLNGSLKIRKNIILNKSLSLNKNSKDKNKEYKLSMLECPLKSWKLESERR
jgi:hypothetical protein